MAVRSPTLSVDDQDYYPVHEEDDVPKIPAHEATVRHLRDALAARFPGWLVTGNVCIYWERGNTRKYRAPDLLLVKEPLTEAVHRVYQTWKQPPVTFVAEVGSKSTFRKDEGPKVEIYRDLIKAEEYLYADPPKGDRRLWRLGAQGYEQVAPEANGRLRSKELEVEFALEDGFLRIYTLEGELLLTHEESELRRQEAEEQVAEEARLRREAEERAQQTEQQRATEARLRQEAELQRAEEARLRREAEERAAELERQLAELRARSGESE